MCAEQAGRLQPSAAEERGIRNVSAEQSGYFSARSMKPAGVNANPSGWPWPGRAEFPGVWMQNRQVRQGRRGGLVSVGGNPGESAFFPRLECKLCRLLL